MKNHALLFRLGSFFLVWVSLIYLVPPKAQAKAPNGISLQVFYNELAPYGDWVNDARYGYIWLPAVNHQFQPYRTNGHWVMTEYGNTWVSYYDWGWAPFHYGNWIYEDFYGWAWVPGYEWAPAWVDWRSGGGYYGWAPSLPAYYPYAMIRPNFSWVFIPQNRFGYSNWYRYQANYRHFGRIYQNTTYIQNTVVYNNYNYSAGPDRREIEQATRRVVPVYQVNNSNNPGRTAVRRNSLDIYKPEIQRSASRKEASRPSRILNTEEVRTARSQQGRTTQSPATTPSRVEAQESRPQGSEVRSSATDGRTSAPTRTEVQSQRPSTSPSRTESFSTRPAENQVRTSAPVRSTPSRSSGEIVPSTRPEQSPSVRPSVNDRGNSESRFTQPTRSNSSESRSPAPARTSSQDVRTSTPTRTQSSQRVNPAPTRSTTRTAPATGSNSNAPSRPATRSRGN